MSNETEILESVVSGDLLHELDLTSSGDVFTALMWRRLFWPDTFVVAGAVFISLAGVTEQNVLLRMDEAREGRPQVTNSWSRFVESFSWFEVIRLLQPSRARERESEALAVLGGHLVASWKARLSQLHPERTFSIAVVDDEQSYDELFVEVRQEAPLLVAPPGFV